MEETIYDSGFEESVTYDPTVYQATDVASSAAGGMFLLVMFVVFVALYVYMAYCLQQIAKKTNTPNDWLAWIPIANIVLMVQIARLPLWWIVGLFIPFVNIGVIIYLWWKIAEARNRPGWWSILMLISPVNLVLLWFLAFREGTTQPPIPNVQTPTV